MSIIVLVESSGMVYYNINAQLAYLTLKFALSIIYAILVSGRLLAIRKKMKPVIGREHIRTYETIITMVVQSAALYVVLEVVFMVSFALRSNVLNLVFLSISHVQVSSFLFLRLCFLGCEWLTAWLAGNCSAAHFHPCCPEPGVRTKLDHVAIRHLCCIRRFEGWHQHKLGKL
jgi:hypothetical protein